MSATVDEAKKMRSDVEGAIEKLISDYEWRTGCHIRSVKIQRESGTVDGANWPVLAVELDVSLAGR